MISPTGNSKVRVDSEGDGHWNSKRGDKKHAGVDFICDPYQDIIAPFDMYIERMAYPYKFRTTPYEGIRFSTAMLKGKMFYFKPKPELIGSVVRQGKVIGEAQDISLKYGSEMIPHIHFQIDNLDPMVLIELTQLADKYSVRQRTGDSI